MNKKTYRFLYAIFSRVFKVLFRIKLTGAQNEPPDKPLLVCANHTSAADVVVIAACMKRQIRFFAKAELFRIPLLRGLITTLGAFPVDRAGHDASSVKRAISLLSEGEAVGIFPQGTRRPGVDPRTTPVKPGVAMIAARSSAAVMPVCIRTKNNRLRVFRRTEVIFGEPVSAEELAAFENYREGAEYIFSKVTDLL